MIAYLRRRLAQHRLSRMVKRNRESFRVQDYARRRQAALKARRG